MRLEDWFIGWNAGQEYVAPEFRTKCIAGRIYGHPFIEDGTDVKVSLSGLAKSKGRVITTKMGEVYELGKPEPGYRQWLQRENVPYDDANPIKLVETYLHPGLSGKRPPGGGRASS